MEDDDYHDGYEDDSKQRPNLPLCKENLSAGLWAISRDQYSLHITPPLLPMISYASDHAEHPDRDTTPPQAPTTGRDCESWNAKQLQGAHKEE